MRNADPVICPLSALAFYFFDRWGRDGAEEFPSFRQPDDYYSHFVFPETVQEPGRRLSHTTQVDRYGWMLLEGGILWQEKTLMGRKQSVRHAELNNVAEAGVRRPGRWKTEAMTEIYGSYLPRGFMRSMAGLPKKGKGYFLPRAREVPGEGLCSKIWPEVDVWLERMEAFHPDRADNEVFWADLAGWGFLRLLRELRVILLQDSVMLRQEFPMHGLWKDSLFRSEEYRKFAERVEGTLTLDQVSQLRSNSLDWRCETGS
jgi:Centromere DNA-binding protein complex CBF3 subunit, domain 2